MKKKIKQKYIRALKTYSDMISLRNKLSALNVDVTCLDEAIKIINDYCSDLSLIEKFSDEELEEMDKQETREKYFAPFRF